MNILQKIIISSRKTLKRIKPYTVYPNSDIRYITEFKDGYALALISNPKRYVCSNILDVAILDTKYKVSLITEYHSFGYWNNGYLIAYNSNYDSHKNKVLLDKNLKEVPNLRYGFISTINSYFEVYSTDSKSQIGLLDKNLQLILPISYSQITDISENRFFCKSTDDENVVFDAIQKRTFKVAIAHLICDEDKNGWYRFRTKNNTFGYFDNDFNVVVKPIYQSLGNFDKNGYAPFVRDGIAGVVDKTGKEFIG